MGFLKHEYVVDQEPAIHPQAASGPEGGRWGDMGGGVAPETATLSIVSVIGLVQCVRSLVCGTLYDSSPDEKQPQEKKQNENEILGPGGRGVGSRSVQGWRSACICTKQANYERGVRIDACTRWESACLHLEAKVR